MNRVKEAQVEIVHISRNSPAEGEFQEPLEVDSTDNCAGLGLVSLAFFVNDE